MMISTRRIVKKPPQEISVYRNTPYEYQFTGEIGRFTNIITETQIHVSGQPSLIGKLQSPLRETIEADSENDPIPSLVL